MFAHLVFSGIVLMAVGLVNVQAQSAQMVVGMSLPLSGSRAASGAQFKAGAEACLVAANANVRLEVHDDGGDPARAITNTRTMVAQSNVLLVLGGGDTEVTTAVMPVLEEANLSMIGAASGAEMIRQGGKVYLFHARASYLDESAAIVKQLYELGISDITIVYADSALGREGLDGMRVEASRLAMRFVAAALPANGTFGQVAKVVAKAAAPAVVLIAPYDQAARFIRELRETGDRPRFVGVSVVSAERLSAELGEIARGIGVTQVVPLPWGTKLALVRDYHTALKAHGSAKPGYESLEGCIYARLGVEAIKRAGRLPTRAKVYAALDNGVFDLGGYPIRFNSEHRGTRFVEMTVIGPDGRITR
jgi:branched-chain amino acid transport system substrate-binding protein